MKNNRTFTITILSLATFMVYFFISAPPPLAEKKGEMRTISIAVALRIMEQQNDVARALYTKEIVGQGKKRGIKFDEEWEDKEVHAGPLPAQFLRLIAESLERSPIQLGLFLGSDYAINKANTFEGQQLKMFQEVKESREASFFYVKDAERYAYMAPDIASSKPCVTCHNEHDESPKDDWELDDVMGAVTWTYPKQEIGYKEMLEMVTTLRAGFEEAYTTFLEETQKMAQPPPIGSRWPRNGFQLPDTETFMIRLNWRSSEHTLRTLLSTIHPTQKMILAQQESQTKHAD